MDEERTFYCEEAERNCPFVSRFRYCSCCELRLGVDDPKERTEQTNADRIRAMSDEELAEYIDSVAEACYNAGAEELPLSNSNPLSNAYNILEWLKQPAEVE